MKRISDPNIYMPSVRLIIQMREIAEALLVDFIHQYPEVNINKLILIRENFEVRQEKRYEWRIEYFDKIVVIHLTLEVKPTIGILFSRKGIALFFLRRGLMKAATIFYENSWYG